MTIKELMKYNDLKIEIKQLNEDLLELNNISVGSSKISDMPCNSKNHDNLVEKIIEKILKLEKKIKDKLDNLLNQKIEIENFLESIEDDKTRIIIRSRFIDGESWYEIGKKLHFDRTTPYYHLKKYFNNREKMEDKEEMTKIKELLSIINITEEEYNKLDYKGKQRYYKAKSKLCDVLFVSRDASGKGITYIRPKEEKKEN